MDLESIIQKSKNNFKKFLLAGLMATSLTLYSCKQPIEPSEPSPEPPQEKTLEVKTGTSDTKGQINFIDNSTQEEVTLNIVDKENQSPVSDVRATYWDGNNFEVFLIDDPSLGYLPTIGIYPHNSVHTLETGKFGKGVYEITRVNENDSLSEVIWSWKSESGMEFSTYSYEKTVSYEESIAIRDRQAAVLDLAWKFTNIFLGIPLPAEPSEIINHTFPNEENPPQRWDIYSYRDGYNETSHLTMIPSNIPTIEITNLDTRNDEISASWKGNDKDTYEQMIFLPSNKDITKYLDGNSTSDLKYSHRITQKNTGTIYKNWTPYSSKTSVTINIPDSGDYSLEIRVKDEVDNIGTDSRNFSIEGVSGTMTDPRDDRVYDIVKIGNQWWMAENLNYDIQGSSWNYDDDPSNGDIYGRLYSWEAAKTACPNGWHLPTDIEWETLGEHLANYWWNAGGDLKSVGIVEEGTGLWHSPNTGATNESGFTALPGGYRRFGHSFYDIYYKTYFWAEGTGAFSEENNWFGGYGLIYDDSELHEKWYGSDSSDYNFYVRCIKS